MSFDPKIESYFNQLRKKLDKVEYKPLPNQFYYYTDLYHRENVKVHPTITTLLGLSSEKFNLKSLYDLIHPADRFLVYQATLESIRYANRKYNSIPFENVFMVDFRIKHINGNYIRLLRETGCAVNDKLGSMVYSFAIFTDISNIKTSNKVGFDYKGTIPGMVFPNKKLLQTIDVFSKQEKRILYQLSYGKESKEIAELLFISKHTVDTHRRNMLRKALLKNTPELITYAIENGII